MKKSVLTVVFIVQIGFCFSQIHRNVQVKPFIDTTSVEFKGIFRFWESYMDTLAVYSIKSHMQIKETNESINAFWTDYDVGHYNFPDLVYGSNFGMAFYPVEKEYFLGFARRDTNLFEIRTMFVNLAEDLFHGSPDIMFSIPIIKTGDSYRLYNKFSLLLKEKRIITKKFGDITYYYSPFYDFNTKEAKILNERIKKFKEGFQIKNKTQIKYLTADNFTEILSWFGVNYYGMDYYAELRIHHGYALPINNMIISGGGGENYMHEIIHILLKGIRKGKYKFFEEGIACYFGDHNGKNYQYHAKRLKKYLNDNNWIDLSKNLKGYYKTDTVSHSYVKPDEKYPMKNFHFYKDDTTEFSYIIHAVLCEMAFRQGGYKKVMDILKAKADNDDEFYAVIEKQLGIKRQDVDKTIREFLNKNY